MMKKRLFALLLAIVTVVALTTHAFAVEVEYTPTLPPHVHEGVAPYTDISVQAEIWCTECNWPTVSHCYGDIQPVESGSHTYGFGKTCYITWFTSKGGYKCYLCDTVYELDYVDQFGDRHYCLERHSSCSLGEYSWCPMGRIGGWQ